MRSIRSKRVWAATVGFVLGFATGAAVRRSRDKPVPMSEELRDAVASPAIGVVRSPAAMPTLPSKAPREEARRRLAAERLLRFARALDAQADAVSPR